MLMVICFKKIRGAKIRWRKIYKEFSHLLGETVGDFTNEKFHKVMVLVGTVGEKNRMIVIQEGIIRHFSRPREVDSHNLQNTIA